MTWQALYVGAACAFFLVAMWLSGGSPRTSVASRLVAAACCSVAWPAVLLALFIMVLVSAFDDGRFDRE